MDEQPVKYWVCRRRRPYSEWFVTRNPDLARDARKLGFRCKRWRRMEDIMSSREGKRRAEENGQ